MRIKTLQKNVYFILLLLPLISPAQGNKTTSNEIRFVQLKNWQYRIGDSLVDSNGNLLWLNNTLNSEKWKSIKSLDELPLNSGVKKIWLRTVIPDYKFINPAIYLGQVEEYFQVYLNKKLIYQLGDFSSFDKVNFLGWQQNLIPIRYHKKGDVITLRIWCGSGKIGPAGYVLIGSAENLFKELFFHNLVDLIFASIFFFIGIASVIIYFGFQKKNLIFGIALFLIPISIFISANTSFLQMIFKAPRIFYQLDHFSLYAASIGGFFIIEQLVSKKYKKIIRTTWLISLAYMTGDLLSNILWGVTEPRWFVCFLSLLGLNMIISVVVLVLNVKKGGVENKLLLAGMIIFLFSASIELILFFEKTRGNYFGYNVLVIHIGVLSYVISLILIIVYNYINANKEKDIAQEKVLEATKRENKAQSEFASKLIESQEQERKRIAGELHDSIGQDLLIAKNLLLINKEKAFTAEDEIPKMLSKTIREISEISHNLRPSELDELGLTMAVESMVDRIQEASNIKFKLNIEDIDYTATGDNGINLFRIIQEALNNIVKHSKAAEVVITSKLEKGFLILQINDNGVGFDEANYSRDNRPHFGLSEIKERVKYLKGQLHIFSNEDKGTTLKISIPIKEDG